MRTTVTISFNEGRMRYPFVYAIVKSVNCESGLAGPEDFLCGLFLLTLDVSDPRLDGLRAVLKQNEIKASEQIAYIYTDTELRSFPLLQLLVSRAEIGPFGAQYGTTYDLTTGCPECGTGATQTSPFFAPLSAFPKTGDICKSSCEEFLSTRVADAIKSNGCSGVDLRQVVAAKSREPLPWWQIISTFEMPRFSEKTRGVIRGSPPPCTVCNRDGHYHTTEEPAQLIYSGHDVDIQTLPHVLRTWECFARSWVDPDNPKRRRIANPRILVKPFVFDIFRRLKVKHAHFEPVRIE